MAGESSEEGMEGGNEYMRMRVEDGRMRREEEE